MSKGFQIALGALAVSALLGWAARDALSEDGALASFAYYQTLDEFAASEAGARVRVHGFVTPGSIERDVPGRQVRFLLQQTPPHAARANAAPTHDALRPASAANAAPAPRTADAENFALAARPFNAARAADDANAQHLPVQYTSLETPDLFRDGAEVVVEGRRAQAGAPFVASNLLAKCPSKFEAVATANAAGLERAPTAKR